MQYLNIALGSKTRRELLLTYSASEFHASICLSQWELDASEGGLFKDSPLISNWSLWKQNDHLDRIFAGHNALFSRIIVVFLIVLKLAN